MSGVNTNAMEKTYPIQTLVDIANDRPAQSISHTRKLLSTGLITKTYEKIGNGPGRSHRQFKITDEGRRYLKIGGMRPAIHESAVTSAEAPKVVRVRKSHGSVPELDRIQSLTGPEFHDYIKSVMVEIIAEDRAAKMPMPPRRKRGRPSKAELERRNSLREMSQPTSE